MDKLATLLQQIAEKMGVTVTYAYGVMVRGVMWEGGLMLILGIILAPTALLVLRHIRKTDPRCDDAISFLLGIGSAMALGFGAGNVYFGIRALVAPEYVTILRLLGK